MTRGSVTGDSCPAWVRAVHGFVDGVVIAFCLWTVMYEVSMATQASARTTVLIWSPLALLVLGASTWRSVRERAPAATVDDDDHPDPDDHADGDADRPVAARDPRPGRLVLVLAGVTGLLALGAGAVWWRSGGDNYLWMLALLFVAAAGLLALVVLDRRAPTPPTVPSSWAHAAALLTAVVLGGLMLFIVRGNADDVYYVNRSVWVAEHDTFALNDTMFSQDALPSVYPFPFAAIEGLFGALAGLLGTSATFFSYQVGATFFCVVCAWATWRLAATWAPRHHLLVFLLSVITVLAASRGVFGAFSYYYMWAGKAISLGLMVPLAWVYLTRLAEGRGSARWSLVMLFMCGLGFAGMTPTAVLMAPLVAGAAVLAALAVRHRLGMQLLGAGAFLLGPALAGLAVLLSARMPAAVNEFIPTPWAAMTRGLGRDEAMVGLLLTAMVVGAVLVRRGSARAIAAGAAAVTVAIMFPSIPELIDATTGSAPIYNRLFLTPPLAVLVGMLATVPLGDRLPTLARTGAATVLAIVLALAVVRAGTPIWTEQASGHVVDDPTLVKLGDQRAWRDAQEIAELGDGQVVLAPPAVMSALAIHTTRSTAVVPRRFYLPALKEPKADKKARVTLLKFADPRGPQQRREKVRKAFERLDVTTVCLYPGKLGRISLAIDLGFTDRTETGRLVCLRDPAVLAG